MVDRYVFSVPTLPSSRPKPTSPLMSTTPVPTPSYRLKLPRTATQSSLKSAPLPPSRLSLLTTRRWPMPSGETACLCPLLVGSVPVSPLPSSPSSSSPDTLPAPLASGRGKSPQSGNLTARTSERPSPFLLPSDYWTIPYPKDLCQNPHIIRPWLQRALGPLS